MRCHWRNSVFVLLCMMCLSLHAQDTITLNAVEVTADKYTMEALKPLVMKKLDTIVLQSKSTSNLSDLLIKHSPVFIKTYGPGGTSTASFRGTTASHTLVLWNGFQLNAPTLGQVDFSTIPVFLVDDVSLNWGSGTSNNSGGLGGTVNIDNTHHFGDGFLLDLKQTYGSFNTLGSFITVGNYGKKFSFRVKAYRNSSDNDYEYYNTGVFPPKRMKQRNAEFVDYGVMPEISFMLKNSVISASSWNQWNDRNLPPIMTNANNKNFEEWTKDNFSRNFVSFKTFWNTGNLQLKSAAFVENQRYFLDYWHSTLEWSLKQTNNFAGQMIIFALIGVIALHRKSIVAAYQRSMGQGKPKTAAAGEGVVPPASLPEPSPNGGTTRPDSGDGSLPAPKQESIPASINLLNATPGKA